MDTVGSALASLRPHAGAILAFAISLAVALVARRFGRPVLISLAGGIGVLAGWWFTFGLLTATPRQLPERLPMLMLMAVLATAAAGALARRWRALAWPGAVGVAALAAWWLAGAPVILPDLHRAWPVIAGVLLITLVLLARSSVPWAAPLASASLLLGLFGAGLPGPYVTLGGALLAASLAAALPRAVRGDAVPSPIPSLSCVVGLAGLAVLPVLARGTAADWAAAAAPLAALAVGGLVGTRPLGRWGKPLAAGLAGGLCAGVAFFL